MKKHGGFDIDQMDAMIPWERDTYVLLQIESMKQEQERLKQQQTNKNYQ
jgi:predicted outer membrane protein